MKPRVLMLVASDPRSSARPAEAIRIAAGVGTWRKAEVQLYLRGPAVLALSEFVDELVDEDNFTRYLPILGEMGPCIYVQAGCPELAELGDSPFTFTEISDSELATLVTNSTYSLRF